MKKFALLITDMGALRGSLALMVWTRYRGEFQDQFTTHLASFSLVFIVWILVFYIVNLYDVRLLRRDIHFYQNFFQGIALAGAISILFFYSVPIYGITPKTNLFIFIILFSVIGIGTRLLFQRISETSFKKAVVLVGINPQSLELATFLHENPQLGYELRGGIYIEHGPESLPFNIPAFLGIHHLPHIIAQHHISTVIVSPEALHEASMISILYQSLGQKITFKNLSSFYEQVTNRVPLGAISQMWFLENLSEGSKNAYEQAKRIVDIAVASLLGIITLPLFPFVAIVIRIDLRGPIFYRQERLGRAGQIFSIIKLRTMKDRAERDTGAVWASENDPRITRVGKFLRKSRIDELPQLWNILRGEMSFVGPRAERPEFYEKLKEAIPFYEERTLIKPGLTGWAQINYRYGSSVTDAAHKLQYDLYYIKNRSILLDVGIILKTINIALRQAGR